MTTRSTELLRVAHARPGVTRADAARLLGVGTGAATELVGRLAQASLLAEAPAAPSGSRGRPTTVLVPHPAGPLVLAAAITHETWRIDVVELGGAVLETITDRHAGAPWPEVAAAITATIQDLRFRYANRPRALGIAVPGTVSPDLHLDASNLGWHEADLTALWPTTPTNRAKAQTDSHTSGGGVNAERADRRRTDGGAFAGGALAGGTDTRKLGGGVAGGKTDSRTPGGGTAAGRADGRMAGGGISWPGTMPVWPRRRSRPGARPPRPTWPCTCGSRAAWAARWSTTAAC